MKLQDLDAFFLLLRGDAPVITIDIAQGVFFRCPACTDGHGIIAWFRDRGVPDEELPGPGRWAPVGTGIDDLTLMPSINVKGCWHGFVKDGEITNA